MLSVGGAYNDGLSNLAEAQEAGSEEKSTGKGDLMPECLPYNVQRGAQGDSHTMTFLAKENGCDSSVEIGGNWRTWACVLC